MNHFNLPAPSQTLQVFFWLMTLVVALSLPFLAWRSKRDLKGAALTTALMVLWVAGTGWLTHWPRFRSFELPPPFMLTVTAALLSVTVLLLSPWGKELVASASLSGLILFQSFRFPLEVMMHRAYTEGLMPIQMSFEGRNLDILSGVTALILGLVLLKKTLPNWLLWTWNIGGLLLLFNIVGVAITSTPSALRLFPNDPPNVWVLDVPFVWLPMVMVPAAYFGHLAVAIKLSSGVMHSASRSSKMES